MSWLDNINNISFQIKTGDGLDYDVLWKSSSKSTELNVSSFNFIEVEGSLVTRKKSKSAILPIEFYFQGDDYLEQAEKFEQSAKDSRFWKITHPYYGELNGHPARIERNDDNLNVVLFSIDFWETILLDALSERVYPLEIVKKETQNFDLIASDIVFPRAPLQPSDQKTAGVFLDKLDFRYKGILNNENYNDYREKLSGATNGIRNIISNPSEGMFNIINLIRFLETLDNFPIAQRVKLLLEVYRDIIDLYNNGFGQVSNVPTFQANSKAVNTEKNNKIIFSVLGGVVITSIANSIMNPDEEDYYTVNDVYLQYHNLHSTFENYLALNEMNQVSIYNINNEFHQDNEMLFSLNQVVQSTLFYLLDVAISAKRERIEILTENSNIILLTHKYFGLDDEDLNIERFRQLNNIRNKKLFIFKAGSKIKYLV